jgi:hypothetical protein
MKRVELSVAVMQGWARLDVAQRDKFLEAFVRAALRLDRLHLREWLRQRLRTHPMREVDHAAFVLSDGDMAMLDALDRDRRSPHHQRAQDGPLVRSLPR